MRRGAVVLLLIVGLVSIEVDQAQAQTCSQLLDAQTCVTDTSSAGEYSVEVTETDEGVTIVVSAPVERPPTYVALGALLDGTTCWYITTNAEDSATDSAEDVFGDGAWITAAYNQCPYLPQDIALIESTFASIGLQSPVVTSSPPSIGFTGHPLKLEPVDALATRDATTPALSSGVTATVRATPLHIRIDWGDGTETTHSPAEVPGHTYDLKTCPPDYRVDHPRGHLCHPTLEEYPIQITYRWTGTAIAPWGSLDLGTRSTTSTIGRDIDEIIGVLTQ